MAYHFLGFLSKGTVQKSMKLEFSFELSGWMSLENVKRVAIKATGWNMACYIC